MTPGSPGNYAAVARPAAKPPAKEADSKDVFVPRKCKVCGTELNTRDEFSWHVDEVHGFATFMG